MKYCVSLGKGKCSSGNGDCETLAAVPLVKKSLQTVSGLNCILCFH